MSSGYYRVLYDTLTWNSISKALKNEDFRDIHFLNRAQLIDDSMNFAQTLRIVCIVNIIISHSILY